MPENWKDVKKRVKKWLDDLGFPYKEKTDPEHRFNYSVEFPPGRKRRVHVLQQKRHKDSLTIFSRTIIGETQRQNLGRMKGKQKSDFIWDLQFTLLSRDCQFTVNPNIVNPKTVNAFQLIFYDNLSKTSLVKALEEDWKFYLFISLKFSRITGGTPQSEPTSKYYV